MKILYIYIYITLHEILRFKDPQFDSLGLVGDPVQRSTAHFWDVFAVFWTKCSPTKWTAQKLTSPKRHENKLF